MSNQQDVSYTLELDARIRRRRSDAKEERRESIPRIARLMALAIRLEGLVREGRIRDYAELARLGRVTRARVTQITKLLDLAPDIQEAILFSSDQGLNERALRPIVKVIDWGEQRRMFRNITRAD